MQQPRSVYQRSRQADREADLINGGALPSRVVDRNWRSWYLTRDDHGDVYRSAPMPSERMPILTVETALRVESGDLRIPERPRPPAPRSLEAVIAQWGPVRPVAAPSGAEVAAIEQAMSTAGRKAAATVCAAIEHVHHAARVAYGQQHGGEYLGQNAQDSADFAEAVLVAGRPGSWESGLLTEIVWAGNGYNLMSDKEYRQADVDTRRAAGPGRRVHRDARDQIGDVLQAWTHSPDRYVEVAATLAATVSRFADEQHGSQGWRKVADQWLQPDAKVPDRDAQVCYRLLYSTSAHFNAALLM